MTLFQIQGGQPSQWQWLARWSVVAKRSLKLRQHISIALVSREKMRQLNCCYRHQNKPTDVLSFKLATGAKDKILGEIIICRPVAVQQAKKHHHSLMRELQLLTIHGTMHLLGFDHQSKAAAKKMETAEKSLLMELIRLRQKS